MNKIEYRAVKKFFVKEGLTPNEIHSKFVKFYGDSSPSFSTIKKWAAEFKRGRTGLEDDPREGRPKSATTPEIIEIIEIINSFLSLLGRELFRAPSYPYASTQHEGVWKSGGTL